MQDQKIHDHLKTPVQNIIKYKENLKKIDIYLFYKIVNLSYFENFLKKFIYDIK